MSSLPRLFVQGRALGSEIPHVFVPAPKKLVLSFLTGMMKLNQQGPQETWGDWGGSSPSYV